MSWKLRLIAKENIRIEVDEVVFHVKPVTSLQRGMVLAAWNAVVNQVDGWKHVDNMIDAITSIIADVEHPEFDPKNKREFVKTMPPEVLRQLTSELVKMTLDEIDIKNSSALLSGDSEGENQSDSKAAPDVHSATEKDASL